MTQQTKDCKHCGETFTRFQTGDAVYCSNSCARHGRAKKYTFNGESLSVRHWAEKLGIPRSVLKQRLQKQGMSFCDAIKKPVISNPRGRNKKISAFGEDKTIKEWSSETGISYQTIGNRLRKGMDIEEALTLDRVTPARQPRNRPPIPEGCYWESKFKVVCPNGQVFDHTNRLRKTYPRPVHWVCEQCGVDRYHNEAVGERVATVCRSCNAHNASKAHVDMWAELVEATGYIPNHYGAGTFRTRASKFGVNYNSGITTALVAERHDHTCQECGIQLQKHHGSGFHPEGWSVGHIVPMSKGGHHEWDNVQAECIACNLWKSNRSESVDWDEVMAG